MSDTHLPEASPPTARPMHAPSVPCVGCTYNLAGVPLDSNCPECGLPVSTTLRHALELQPVAALSRIRSGIWWITASIIGAILFPIPSRVLTGIASGLAYEGDSVGAAALTGATGLLAIGLTVIAMVGFRRFATPLSETDDRRFDKPRVRSAIRITALLSVPLAVVAAANDVAVVVGSAHTASNDAGESWLYTAGFYAMLAVSVLNAINSAVLHLSTAAHAATLAARGARLKLERRAKVIVRLGVIAYAMIILMSVAAIAQVVLSATGGTGVAIFGALGVIGLLVGAMFLILAIAWLIMLSQTLTMVARTRKRLLDKAGVA